MTNKYLWLIGLALCLPLFKLHSQDLKMYVSDAGNFDQPPWQILKFDVDGSNGEVFISDHLDWPQDIVFLENDTVVLISNLNSGEILRFNANTGDYINIFATGIGGPTRMKIGADSLLYVLQWDGNGKVWRYQLDGSFVDEFTAIGVGTSIGLDWDNAGNLYVSSYGEKYVQKFSLTGADLGRFVSTNLAGPTNIWFDDDGDLLVNDYNAGIVKRFDSNGSYEGNFITMVPGSEGIDFLPDGNILLGVGGTSSVRKYSPAGTLISTVVPPGTLNLLTPNAVVLRNESITSGITDPSLYSDVRIVVPSTGVTFQIISNDEIPVGSIAEVCTTSGIVVNKIILSDSTSWDASDLSNGIYMITVPLNGNKIGRQKIMIQH